MKNKIYEIRLLKFAAYLEKVTNHREHGLLRPGSIFAFENGRQIHIDVVTQYWVFEELPDCFPEEWSYHEETGEPFWDELGPESNVAECVSDFFGTSELGHEAFCHLWDINGNQQTDKWGGIKLNEDSDGPAFADNIREYVKRHE